ncbi:MAG: RnfH family protein [Steroidobacteraceae bacterium]|nr:RnfH family protein [Steroidobacteraceae bacterium]
MCNPEPAVEVVYALPDHQRVVRVPLRQGLTAIEAVREADLAAEFPELAAGDPVLGIYGRRVEGTQVLCDGDRVEIYRPLRFDPREARRQAARGARPAGRGRD